MPFRNTVLPLATYYIRINATTHLQHEIVSSLCGHEVLSFQKHAHSHNSDQALAAWNSLVHVLP